MALGDRILDALKAGVQLNERVTGLSREVKEMARDIRDLDRRLVRIETAFELMSGGRFAGLPPALDKKD
jgi:hypothetical protein